MKEYGSPTAKLDLYCHQLEYPIRECGRPYDCDILRVEQ